MSPLLKSAVIAVTPSHLLAPEIAIAAHRAAAFGILDLGVAQHPAEMQQALARLRLGAAGHQGWGVRWDQFDRDAAELATLAPMLAMEQPLPLLVLAGVRSGQLADARQLVRPLAHAVLLEVRELEAARAAQQAGYDGVIVKGHEAGGRVSARSSFMLLQEFSGQLAIPYWIQGGIGLRSGAAAMLSGAAGVVLCEQLWLAAEGPFGTAQARQAWSHLDGSETVLAGAGPTLFRLFGRSGRARLRELELAQAGGVSCLPLLAAHLAERSEGLIAAGQDIALAAPLAQRYGSVGRIVTALAEAMAVGVKLAAEQAALAPSGPLAALLGTRYPIAQGPMTRVSDDAPFARAVADAGALPFLALAVMRGPEVRVMLERARSQLDGLPWGVGLLGFMPLALRQEQLDIVREIRPPFAVIAGGRPSQARELEALGIATYLHVPSPGLLRGFLNEGARHFVFEGSECGGHTGPRTSFALWEQAIDVLLQADIKDPQAVQVMFAGGIHDALSAAMVAALAAPLVARGMKIGVWMGTAYLFTEEIVGTGAIVPEFQRQAVACRDTALLQSGVGIYTRCADTPFCAEFEQVRQQLVLSASSEQDTLMALETMNIGRLRIAAKGVTRNTDPTAGKGARYVKVNRETQRREGIYMLGDVARLRHRTCTIAQLHETVSAGAQRLLAQHRPAAAAPQAAPEAIAIVGMACLLPGAQNLREYWENIMRGVDSIREVSDERWSAEQMFDPRRGAPDRVYAKWGGFLDDIAFEPQTWGIVPSSVAAIEPMQLLGLEVARQALADAGFDRRPFPRERTACIFAVGGMADLSSYYNFRTLLPLYLAKMEGLPASARQQIIDTLNREQLPQWSEDSFPGILGNVVAGRIANRLDLGGSNYTVDAACAASLAALDVCVKQLRDGDADVALAGGIDCTNGAIGFMCFAQTHALSPRGRSRPFDRSADGIAISEGVGALVLKRLSDAERDGDRIYALIKGIGSSSDGRNRSLTAPHPAGQVLALQRAYRDAGLEPSCVSLIEAHGTGTALGDKSEIEALNLAFGGANMAHMARQGCAVGSVKSMIGHAKVAAGMAGLIKAALALQHGVLPPTIGVEQPTTAIDFSRSPFYLNTEARPWLTPPQQERHCGVSAFGFGGTNFHAVLGEYTGGYRAADARSLHPREAEIFVFAGAERAAVVESVRQLLHALEPMRQADLAPLAYALYREQLPAQTAEGAAALPCRLTLMAGSVPDLRQKLQRVLDLLPDHAEIRQPPAIWYRESADHPGALCFLFPGQGSQRVNMLRDLVLGTPALHACFVGAIATAGEIGADHGSDADAALLQGQERSIASLIYPLPVFSEAEREAQQAALNATEAAQPALGMVGMAAFDLLSSYGLTPDCAAGHSYGEYVALCAAGVISRADLQRLSLVRGRLAGKAPAGAMAVLDGDAQQVDAALARHGLALSIANLNSPAQTIVAGSVAAIETAMAALAGEGMRIRKLPVSAAFHCGLMDGVRDALASELDQAAFHAPRFAVYSNTTAAPHADDGAQVRQLLARHIAEPVRFVEQIEALYQSGARVFVECGPGLVLSGLVDAILGARPHTTLALDAPGRPGWQQLAQLLTQALAAGLAPDLTPWFAGRGLGQDSVAQVLAAAAVRAAPGKLAWRVNGGRAVPWYAPQRAPGRSSAPPPAVPTPEFSFETASLEAAAAAAAAEAAEAINAAAGRDGAGSAPHFATVSTPAAAKPVRGSPAPAFGAAPAFAGPLPPPPAPSGSPLPSAHYRRSAMKLDDFLPHDPPAAPQPGAYTQISQISQIQDGLARLLDLQREQQFSLRHFLDFQARLAGVGHELFPQAPSLMATHAAPALHATLHATSRQLLEPAAVPPMPPSPPISAPPVQPAAAGPTHAAAAAPLAAPAMAPVVMLAAVPRAPVLPQLAAAVAPAAVAAAATVPAAAAAPPAAAPAQSGQPAPGPSQPGAAEFKSELLQAVSERTGYPVDMLDLDAHMEADLGIDSIKRIEIFSGLTTRYNLIGERDEETVIAELSGYKTLNEIVGWYAQSLQPAASDTTGDALPKKASAPLSQLHEMAEPGVRQGHRQAPEHPDPVRCYTLHASPAALDDGAAMRELPHATAILLAGAESPLSMALGRLLTEQGCSVRRLLPGAVTRRLDRQRCEVDFSSADGVRAWRELAPPGELPATVLINLMSWSGAAPQEGGPQEGAPDAQAGAARALFLLLQVAGADLKAAAGAGQLLNLTGLDGQFGLSRSRPLAPAGAGTLGVAKSAAREWPAVRVKCVDAQPDLAPEWLAQQLLRELRSADAALEVGYTDAGRWRLELKADDAPQAAPDSAGLESGAVLLVTGGAYGITADIACALAAQYRPRMILVGRSDLPGVEEEATRDIGDAAALQQVLIRDLRKGQARITPAQVNGALKRILRERQIRRNLAFMRASGAEVEYHRLDVRDGAALGALIDSIYQRHGRIDGVLHGAGVIGDKLIADKTPASFDAVFDTKVQPALTLAARLRPAGLKFIAFFSSVAGRFGNAGQCDYSAANEVLNKLADSLSYRWPQVHALAINWGPWDAGMVDDGLRKLYAARAIRPIPVAEGLRHFLQQIARGPRGAPELVISASVERIAAL